MQLTVNGDSYQAAGESSIRDLLDALEIRGRRVAVMVNDEVVRRDRFETTQLHEGDSVEIISMVGGG